MYFVNEPPSLASVTSDEACDLVRTVLQHSLAASDNLNHLVSKEAVMSRAVHPGDATNGTTVVTVSDDNVPGIIEWKHLDKKVRGTYPTCLLGLSVSFDTTCMACHEWFVANLIKKIDERIPQGIYSVFMTV